MLDVCLLGTGGMMPLPQRWLTSLMARYNGKSILIDCGEGTQIAMKEKGWSPKPIDIICFTHYHADHISGLPGMLLTMGNAERTEPLRKQTARTTPQRSPPLSAAAEPRTASPAAAPPSSARTAPPRGGERAKCP